MNKELRLLCICRRRRPGYKKGQAHKIFPNLLNQHFKVTEKNKVWCTDFTYLFLSNGYLRYNCTIIDLYDRSVVASETGKWITSELAIQTLEKALKSQKVKPKSLILHSDQGCQFTSLSFIIYCDEHGIAQSMSRAGCPYDAVIPNYYDPDEFPFQPVKQDYLLYFGRITERKGVMLASEITKATGNKLYVVGPGTLDNPDENISLSSEKHIVYHPAVGPEERAELLGNAKAVLMPTYYIEPFGSVALEAQLCGTPIITTDWGAFPETVLHGVTGYRCRAFEEFCWAVNHIQTIKPEHCREFIVKNYSLERIGKMYEEYFQRVSHLHHEGFYQPNPDRSELDWLNDTIECAGKYE